MHRCLVFDNSTTYDWSSSRRNSGNMCTTAWFSESTSGGHDTCDKEIRQRISLVFEREKSHHHFEMRLIAVADEWIKVFFSNKTLFIFFNFKLTEWIFIYQNKISYNFHLTIDSVIYFLSIICYQYKYCIIFHIFFSVSSGFSAFDFFSFKILRYLLIHAQSIEMNLLKCFNKLISLCRHRFLFSSLKHCFRILIQLWSKCVTQDLVFRFWHFI